MSVCVRMNQSVSSAPNSMNGTQESTSTNRPLVAARLARSKSFAPSALDSSAFIPTPVPVATAIIRFWIGKASDTAVSASSLMRATNIESTMLYSAWISIEIIMGSDMLISSLPTGITPILFSCICLSCIKM